MDGSRKFCYALFINVCQFDVANINFLMLYARCDSSQSNLPFSIFIDVRFSNFRLKMSNYLDCWLNVSPRLEYAKHMFRLNSFWIRFELANGCIGLCHVRIQRETLVFGLRWQLFVFRWKSYELPIIRARKIRNESLRLLHLLAS